MKNKELHAIIDCWPTVAPSAGFADRVLAACAAPTQTRLPPRRARTRLRSVLAVAALVAATVLVPLVLAHSAQSGAPPAVASASTGFDLGPQQD